MRRASLCWSIALVSVSLACGSQESEPAPEPAVSEERASDEPIVVVPPPLIDDEPSALGLPAPQTYEVLESLSRLLVPVPPECASLAEDDPSAPLGAILESAVREADRREVLCTPATGGFHCRVSLAEHTVGEGAERGLFLDLHMDGAHTIDPRSIVCELVR